MYSGSSRSQNHAYVTCVEWHYQSELSYLHICNREEKQLFLQRTWTHQSEHDAELWDTSDVYVGVAAAAGFIRCPRPGAWSRRLAPPPLPPGLGPVSEFKHPGIAAADRPRSERGRGGRGCMGGRTAILCSLHSSARKIHQASKKCLLYLTEERDDTYLVAWKGQIQKKLPRFPNT